MKRNGGPVSRIRAPEPRELADRPSATDLEGRGYAHLRASEANEATCQPSATPFKAHGRWVLGRRRSLVPVRTAKALKLAPFLMD